MDTYDLVIRGGTIATASETFAADLAIKDGKIAALARAGEAITANVFATRTTRPIPGCAHA